MFLGIKVENQECLINLNKVEIIEWEYSEEKNIYCLYFQYKDYRRVENFKSCEALFNRYEEIKNFLNVKDSIY